MIRICFVCHGNICRSPMAEFIMKKLVSDSGYKNDFLIESRATHTDEIWNGVGSHIYPPAEAQLIKKNIPFDKNKRATLLKKSDYDNFDLFIGMDRENMRYIPRILGSDKENKIHKLLDYTQRGGDVSDPWYSRNFDLAYKDIYEGCEGLLKTILLQQNVIK